MKRGCCERSLRKTGKWLSGFNQNGDLFECPACRSTWVYIEDEAEGGSWVWERYGVFLNPFSVLPRIMRSKPE